MSKVLIVGAGSVGQVYGHYLLRGGNEVSFLVKPQYVEACEAGFTLFRCRRRGLGQPEHYHAEAIYSDLSQLVDQQFDQVWLAVPSTGLYGEWLPHLKSVIGNATLVMLQPDLDDRDFVLQTFPADQVVYGAVNFLSYHTPLPDLPAHHPDAGKQGIAYLLLPLLGGEFSGPPERLPGVLEALTAGRFPVRVQQNVPRSYADRSAWMIPLVALLEIEQWSFQRVIHSDSLSVAVTGAQQALGIVAAKFGRPRNLTEKAFNAWVVRMLLPLIRWLTPMDAESYLKYQFQKTAPQTRVMLAHFIAQGEKSGLPTHALKVLLNRLPVLEQQAA